MNIKKILAKGFFPKELPPPFTTEVFAEKAQYIHRQWNNFQNAERIARTGESNNDARKRFFDQFNDYGSSKYLTFSLAKGIYSRRKLGVLNPKQYHDLCKFVCDNWKTIRNTYDLSSFSASIPTEANAIRAVRTKSMSLNNFKFLLIEKSFNKRYELRLDISQFYPSIYTHSIPWAIMGKILAKRYFVLKNNPRYNWNTQIATDPDAALYDFCDKLDMLVRNCQERQSIGIPIGPDVSFILAEIIGNRVDSEIKNKLGSLDYSCLRYYDDYYFYTRTFSDAEKILKITQHVLNDFQLETNENKVQIKELPFSFEADWAPQLSIFRFKSVNKYEIRNFFSVLFTLIKENPKDSSWIITYALGRFEYGNTKIKEEDWDLFLNLLIKTLLIDASNIDQFLKILLSYVSYLTTNSKKKIGQALQNLISEHLILNHSFEVSWALWILKSLKIKCENDVIDDVLKSDDYVSQLICLDIIQRRLIIKKRISLPSIASNLNTSDLFTDKWLFTYESIMQNWLKPTRAVISGHEYFHLLVDHKVTFYDTDKQIETEFLNIPVKPPQPDVPVEVEAGGIAGGLY